MFIETISNRYILNSDYITDVCDKNGKYLARLINDSNLYEISEKDYLKLKEQEPCEDCISREEAVTEINKYHMTSGVTHQCVWNECVGVIAETIQELPPVTPQPKTEWIPCSERLPEIHQDVLLTLRSLEIEVGYRAVAEPYFFCHGGYIEPQNVLAWQPLPEPCKPESEE